MGVKTVSIYDTTLRDGTQGEGIIFSCSDKLRIARRLDKLGVAYIEGGWPGSNPKDLAFFREAAGLSLKHAKITAFGSTRRKLTMAENDENLRMLLDAGTPVVTIFGKTWLLHVQEVLGTTPDENLAMVRESCRYLADHGKETIFDAEHFFDGYLDDPDYALAVLQAAIDGGASTVTLCDTNGGRMPDQIHKICKAIRKAVSPRIRLGIHCHNDSDTAVASSLLASQAGAALIQGTINGYGERCGNTNLCSVMANLELNYGVQCLPDGNLRELKSVSEFVDEMANRRHDGAQPFVGNSAFTHKGGMHIDAVSKNPVTFEHHDPAAVGNRRRILVSDLTGKQGLIMKALEYGFIFNKTDDISRILAALKEKERQGYEYESAGASFLVLLNKLTGRWSSYFNLEGFRVIVEKRRTGDKTIAEATVKLSVNGISELTAAEGEGPVNALDLALRKSLERFYPELKGIYLSNYKVRILEGDGGTASQTRVLIESCDGSELWDTVGLSENIIQASWEALVDSVEYALFKKHVPPIQAEHIQHHKK